MTKLVELLINGISLGFLYALIALGFVLVFRAAGVLNFAHASLLLLGGYVVASFQDDIGFFPAVAAGLLAAAVGAMLIEWIFIRRLRGADLNVLAILTIGVDILLTTELTRRIGVDVLAMGDPWGSKVVDVGGITIAQTRLVAMVVGVVLITGFMLAFRYTPWGVAMRAAAEDGEAAALMGIRLTRVSLLAWCIAGALAAVAAVFLTVFPTPGLDRATGLTALKAFPAAILGGLDSTTGALVGGLIIGIAESLATGYQDNLLFLGRGFASVAPYAVMVLVLLIRPAGLFGTKELTRV